MVSPSLLSANFIDLKSDVEMINKSEADWLHMDIMDGVFVPNISFGFPVLEAVAKVCTKPLDVHFMIVHPEQYIEQTAKIGAMMMNVHYEACTHLHRTVQQIHNAGMKAAVTLNPATPVSMLEDIIDDVDMVLLMMILKLFDAIFREGKLIKAGLTKPDDIRRERLIRRIAKYRNNSYFVGSPESGVRFARLMSHFANIRKHNLDPVEYLCDVFRRIKKTAKDKLVDLLAHRWQLATVTAWA